MVSRKSTTAWPTRRKAQRVALPPHRNVVQACLCSSLLRSRRAGCCGVAPDACNTADRVLFTAVTELPREKDRHAIIHEPFFNWRIMSTLHKLLFACLLG